MNIFIVAIISSLSLSFGPAYAGEDEDLDAFLQKSKKMIANGHNFYRSLACPDGSTPYFVSVGTGAGFRDTYQIACKDGTKGSFVWDPEQKAPPAPPTGFRLKTEAELNAFSIKGRVSEISISPAGPIWITTKMGYSYYLQNLESKWETGSLRATEEYANDIQSITFFDQNIAIATGGLNGRIFRTEDGGKTWTDSKPTHSQWVYHVFSKPDGKVWMGGSSGVIVHSVDFGKTWKELKTKFSKDNRMASIFMITDKAGIAGSLDGDELLLTSDNWATSKQIPTPKSQGLVSKVTRDTISAVAMFDNEFIVTQGGYVFRSPLKSIKWSELKDPSIAAFSLDSANKSIFLIDRQGHAYNATTLKSYSWLSADLIRGGVVDVKNSNGFLYVLDSQNIIYKINSEKFEKSAPLPR